MISLLMTVVPFLSPVVQEAPPEPPEETVEALTRKNRTLRDSNEALETRVAALEEENKRLLANIANTDAKIVEMAREIARLQKIIREELRATPPATPKLQPEPAKTEPKPTPTTPALGPGKAITGEVMSNNVESGVILLRPGQNGGITAGMKFEVVRDHKRIGVIMIDKSESRIARASVIEGDRKQIKVYDQIVELVNPEAAPVEHKPVPGDPLGEKVVETAMAISGVIDQEYLITGETGSLQVGSKVYVYRDKTLKGILTITRVDKDGATARLSSEGGDGDIRTNDAVVLKERKTNIAGIIMIVNAQSAGINIGTDNGVAKGQVYVVERLGNVVGELRIVKVETQYSFAEPMPGSELTGFRRSDSVRLKQ